MTRLRMWGALAGVTLVAGCSSPASEPAVDLPVKNEAQWVMPLNRYQLPAADPASREGWLVGMTACMREAGYPAPEVPRGFARPKDPASNAVGYRLFTPEVLGRYGYHHGEEITGRTTDPGDEMAKLLPTWGKPGAEAFARCSAKFDNLLHVADDTKPNSANWLALEAERKAAADPAVKQAASAWGACMKPLGLGQLPDSPAKFPDAAYLEQIKPGFGTDKEPESSVPSAEELRVAKHDAKCRQESGYQHAAYEATWNAEVGLIKKNYADLEGDLEKAESTLAQARKVAQQR